MVANASISKYSEFIKLGLDHGKIDRLGQYMKRVTIIEAFSQLKRKTDTMLFLDTETNYLSV